MEELKEPLIDKNGNVPSPAKKKRFGFNQRASSRKHLQQVDDTDTDNVLITNEDIPESSRSNQNQKNRVTPRMKMKIEFNQSDS